MFDDESDLMVRGVAAAKSGDRDEAKFYLEWVIRSDADLEQQSNAWYWLSLCTDSPDEKRNCLENVLAAFPGHPEARRDLAILDGRLKREDILDLRQPVAPVVPSSVVADAERSMCPRCGAKMLSNQLTGVLACQFCGYKAGDNAALTVNDDVQEQDWVAAIYTQRGHTWEMPTSRTLLCSGCGATVSFAPSRVSTTCLFCGSPYSVQEAQEQTDLIQPEGVILFAFDDKTALTHARQWLGSQRFAPGDLEAHATFSLPRPIYLPFWTFNTTAEIAWTRTTAKREHGRLNMVEEHGSDVVTNDEVLVPGTSSLSKANLADMQFDMKALVPYVPGILVSRPAEIYSISAADASLEAHQIAARAANLYLRTLLESSVESSMEAGLQTNPPFITVTSYKLLLLPIWTTQYTYRGTIYALAINGQTGQAHGSVPRNKALEFVNNVFS